MWLAIRSKNGTVMSSTSISFKRNTAAAIQTSEHRTVLPIVLQSTSINGMTILWRLTVMPPPARISVVLQLENVKIHLLVTEALSSVICALIASVPYVLSTIPVTQANVLPVYLQLRLLVVVLVHPAQADQTELLD